MSRLGQTGRACWSVVKPLPRRFAHTQTTGSAKLFQDAIEEEASTPATSSSNRDHLKLTQGPIWSGEEAPPDAVLRMLVDAHKPLRSGQGVRHDAADEKIKGWMKSFSVEPRLPNLPHRTTIPPHLHRPWHSTYTGDTEVVEEPKIKYGTFMKTQADSLDNLLELKLPPNADAKTRAKIRSLRKTGRLVKRVETAREGALDYRLGAAEGEDTFAGNRQVKGSSVLGAQKGSASGIRAWAGLVEDRIQRAKGELPHRSA